MKPLTFLFQKIFQKLLFKKTKELYVASEIDRDTTKREIFVNCKEYINYEIEKDTQLGKKFRNAVVKGTPMSPDLVYDK